ncbi:MAG: HDIG domain-containing metalloprotein [Pseudomonadota bacterium]
MGKKKKILLEFLNTSKLVPWAILFGVTIIFTVIQYPKLVITRVSYGLGDVVEKDIKASKNFFIEDEDATNAKRRQAEEEVLTVYDHDVTLASRLSLNVAQAFDDLREVLEPEPAVQNESAETKADTGSNVAAAETADKTELIRQMKTDFEKKIGITISSDVYSVLEKEKFAPEISNIITSILIEILDNGVVTNKELLLREIDTGITLRTVGTNEEIVVYKLKKFYGLDQAKTMVRILGQPVLKDMHYNTRNLVVDFVQRLISPNITLNRSETEERRNRAAATIKPVLYKIKAGEMVLREGERVNAVQLLKLRASQAQSGEGHILASSAGTTILVLCLLVTTYILHIKHRSHTGLSLNKNLLLIASVLVTFLIFATISASLFESLARNAPFSLPASSISFGIPIASGAMTICLFLGLDVAVPFALVLAVCTAVLFQNRFEIFFYFLINSAMAAYWIQDCRERKVFIKAGAKIGLLNVILATAITLLIGDFSGFGLLWIWGAAFLGGLGAGVVTTGIAPLVEIALGYTTDITLLELANLDRPLLRRLMLEAPGTYHHSVIVGSMVEAAAAEIGAHPLLAKVCGYYHDIGKVKKPLYFIENQTNGINKHDKLAPTMSKRILIAHVKDGVEMAGENKLGQAIIDTIEQSHGTSVISYFYEKAKQLKGDETVEINDFRYPGPKPQTREAGLVMLADVVEAASRTLDNPTPSRIQGLVQNLINKIFSDGQLDDCELTLKDLHKIAKSYIKILYGIHHHRVEYPDKVGLVNGKVRDGGPHRRQAKQSQNSSGKDTAKGPGHLRRLGMS